MEVVAISVPIREGWRWRIVNYAGDLVEESFDTFGTIASAVAEGRVRLTEMNVTDVSVRPSAYRRTRPHSRMS